jgi:hypothetical protein
MKMRMNVPPRVLGKVQFRELGEATVTALTGGKGVKTETPAPRMALTRMSRNCTALVLLIVLHLRGRGRGADA